MKNRLLHPRLLAGILFLPLLLTSCGSGTQTGSGDSDVLLLALAVLGKDEQGKPRPLPSRMVILQQNGEDWESRVIEDPDSTALHKAMPYRSGKGHEGILTAGGASAAVKLWSPGGAVQTLWEADFGGKFSRMRDLEVGDIYGDGEADIAVVTHDQGVVAVLRPQDNGEFKVEELDRQADIIVHEVELGDVNGDGVLEIYATPSAPNRLDGSDQHGQVVRYVPAAGTGREEILDLGDRHAKEILAEDMDGDGRDELYLSVEAVSGGQVEIRRYRETFDESSITVVASLRDRLCRFLTAGDVDGDGQKEMVAAANRSGLWLLRPGDGDWTVSSIDSNSSGFEHASILLDMDGDGRHELYVASDRQSEVRRYRWSQSGWKKEVLLKYEDGLSGFTWNIMASPRRLLPN